MNTLQILNFHLKQILKERFYFWNVFNQTVSFFLLQYVITFQAKNIDFNYIFLRSAIIGLWSSCILSAGAIGYQRYQGTLLYILNNNISDIKSIITVIVPTSIIGLLSFPISYILSILLGHGIELNYSEILGVVLFWIGAVVISILISFIFVLSRNAQIYEELLLFPILIISGLFPLKVIPTYLNHLISWLIPISAPLKIMQSGVNFQFLIQFLTSVIIWILFETIISKYIFSSYKNGKLELI